MFVTIRRYSPKNGAVNRASLEVLRRQVHDEYLPVIQQVPGFHAFYAVSVGNREVLTLTFCHTPEAAAELARCAADYTMRNPMVFELGRPEVTDGEVLNVSEIGGPPAIADMADPGARLVV
jgi:hypothetical protein